jgi:DNA polymerase/3'-5' exonuclease PolX
MENTISLQAKAMSLEAFNVKASIKAMKELLPNFVKSITDFYSTLVVAENQLTLDLIKADSLEKTLKEVDYAAVRKMLVVGPKGLKGTYLDYLGAVEKAVDHAESLREKVLSPFMSWVTLLLSTPENLMSVRKPPLVSNDRIKLIDTIKEDLTKNIDPNSHQQRHLYGKLVQRNKDWSAVVDKTNELIDRYSRTDRKQIKQMVDDTVEALNRLILRVEEDPETYEMSGTTVATLAEQSYLLGKELEHYATTGYLLQELHTTVTDTVEELKKVFGH